VLLRLSRPPSSPSLTEYADWVSRRFRLEFGTPAATFMMWKVLYEVGIT